MALAKVKLHDPHELDAYEWRQMQSIYRDATMAVLDRPQEDIDAYVDWDDPERFYLSHVDPNSEVGKRYHGNQSFSHPKIAIAYYVGEPVGFLYSANNVSGETPDIRRQKELSVAKNYRWLREVVVAPWMQHHGVAAQLGRKALRHANPLQPVSTYIYPEFLPFLPGKLEMLGFKRTGEQSVHAFGEDNEAVNLVRMQARSAYGVLARLYARQVGFFTAEHA